MKQNKDIKVYIIAGKARSGKNTTADIIKEIYEDNGKKICILNFADTIKDYAKKYFGWDGSEETKPRKLLQELGTDIIRQKLNKPDFHVARTCENIEVLSEFFDGFVIPDARFPNEMNYAKQCGFDVVTIHVVRENFDSPLTVEQQQHPSETALDNYDAYDYEIIAKDLDELNLQVRKVVKI